MFCFRGLLGDTLGKGVFMLKNAKEVVKTTLVYAGVGMAVMKAVKEISKARDYFDKK